MGERRRPTAPCRCRHGAGAQSLGPERGRRAAPSQECDFHLAPKGLLPREALVPPLRFPAPPTRVERASPPCRPGAHSPVPCSLVPPGSPRGGQARGRLRASRRSVVGMKRSRAPRRGRPSDKPTGIAPTQACPSSPRALDTSRPLRLRSISKSRTWRWRWQEAWDRPSLLAASRATLDMASHRPRGRRAFHPSVLICNEELELLVAFRPSLSSTTT